MPKLKNKRYERFCLELVSGRSNTQAAIEAGYSERTAYSQANQLLKKLEIKDRIEELQAQMASEKIADATEVLQFNTAVMRGEIQEDVLIGDGMGEQHIAQKGTSIKDRLKAAEALGKYHGLAEPKPSNDANAIAGFLKAMKPTAEDLEALYGKDDEAE